MQNGILGHSKDKLPRVVVLTHRVSKVQLGSCSLFTALQTKNTSQMNFPGILTAAIISINSNLAKCTSPTIISILRTTLSYEKKYFIIIVFQISSVKILCIFVFFCCGYEHLYNYPRIASQPAKSKILIMWPLYRKEKEIANPCHRLTICQNGERDVWAPSPTPAPPRTNWEERTGPAIKSFFSVLGGRGRKPSLS